MDKEEPTLSIKYSLRLYEEPPDRERGGSMNADGKKPIEGNFHAVSCSGGKDNEKRYKMKNYLQKD